MMDDDKVRESFEATKMQISINPYGSSDRTSAGVEWEDHGSAGKIQGKPNKVGSQQIRKAVFGYGPVVIAFTSEESFSAEN